MTSFDTVAKGETKGFYNGCPCLHTLVDITTQTILTHMCSSNEWVLLRLTMQCYKYMFWAERRSKHENANYHIEKHKTLGKGVKLTDLLECVLI